MKIYFPTVHVSKLARNKYYTEFIPIFVLETRKIGCSQFNFICIYKTFQLVNFVRFLRNMINFSIIIFYTYIQLLYATWQMKESCSFTLFSR